MVLHADDELRHPKNDDYFFRESLYFNFNDEKNGIGGWIYLWVTPNKESPAGMLVSFYHGRWPDLTITDKAMAAPRHRLVDGDRWIYCFKRDVDFQLQADFDDVELCGLKLRRTAPLSRYHLSFDDHEGASFEIDGAFTMTPFDYADGVNPTPSWVAANRYHRSWLAKGVLNLGDGRFDIDCSGDSDHSWGQRHPGVFAVNLFKMWSFQTSDGRMSVSAIQQGPDGGEFALGFTEVDGKVASVATIAANSRYDEDGVQQDVELTITDALDRTVRARFGRMHSHLGFGTHSWGYEGVGDYEVEGHGRAPGLISYFWPSAFTPASLHASSRR
jgi:hypothetical protein